MQYDPIKRSLGEVFDKSPFLRILFYKLLDLLLLRAWHIQKELRKWAKARKNSVSRYHKVHILDAGAGFGQYTHYLSGMNRSWNILAVDVKKEQVSDCNNFFRRAGRKSVLFKIANLTTFRMQDTFDLILSVDVMEHIKEDNAVFKNFYESLKEEGMLLISTPSDKGGSDVHADGATSFIEEHVRNGYNRKSLRDQLYAAGFSKVESHYSYGIPGKISWLLSMKYPILMLGAGKVFFILLPFYYLIMYPVCFVLNYFDLMIKWRSGTGLIVKAWK